jgi:hypothetical protein
MLAIFLVRHVGVSTFSDEARAGMCASCCVNAIFELQGQTAGRSYSTLERPTGSACGRAACGKLARRNLANPALPSPSRAEPAPRSAAPAKLGRGRAARFFEVLTAAWHRPRAARGRAARAQLVGRKLAHPSVPSPSLSVRASSTQPTSCLLNPIRMRLHSHRFSSLLFSSRRLKFRAIDNKHLERT